LLYNGPLLCGFNVPIKGLKCDHRWPCVRFNCSSCVEQFANGSAVFWVMSHWTFFDDAWKLNCTSVLTTDTAPVKRLYWYVWLTFTFPAAFCCGHNLEVYRLFILWHSFL